MDALSSEASRAVPCVAATLAIAFFALMSSDTCLEMVTLSTRVSSFGSCFLHEQLPYQYGHLGYFNIEYMIQTLERESVKERLEVELSHGSNFEITDPTTIPIAPH